MYNEPMPAKPASEPQYTFLRNLLAERDVATTGVTDTDALITHLRSAGADTRTLGKLIDTVKALPRAGAAPAANGQAPVRSNAHAGKCRDCGKRVNENTGRIERNASGKWDVMHLAGQCPTGAAAASTTSLPVLDDGLYMRTDGRVFKLYTTQNGHQACKVLVVIETGVDDEGKTTYKGSLEYLKGGQRLVREGVADNSIRALTEDEARAFGTLHGFCVNCARDIDDDRSLAAGYGPVCAANHRWYYPTYAEAAKILGRPVTGPNGKVYEA